MAEVWVISMMKDEEDIAYEWVRHMASEGVDGIIVADNMSTDNTRELLEKAAADTSECRVIIVDDNEVGYFQSEKMSALAKQAADLGATWIIPADADELWYHKDQRLADFLRDQPDDVRLFDAKIINHFVTAQDIPGANAFEKMVWRHFADNPMGKVCFRWFEGAVIMQGNHGVESLPDTGFPGVEIRHFPMRGVKHFIRKSINGLAAYRATDLPEGTGAHWRMYGEAFERGGADVLEGHFYRHFWLANPAEAGCKRDPAPYCRWLPRDIA